MQRIQLNHTACSTLEQPSFLNSAVLYFYIGCENEACSTNAHNLPTAMGPLSIAIIISHSLLKHNNDTKRELVEVGVIVG